MQLDKSEKILEETKRKLVRLRSRGNAVPSTNLSQNGVKVKEERRSPSPVRSEGNSSKSYTPEQHRNLKHDPKPQLVIPAVNPKLSTPIKMEDSGSNSVPVIEKNNVKDKGNRIPPQKEGAESQSRGTKRKFGNFFHFL